jgi:LacI family transcriptional regulator
MTVIFLSTHWSGGAWIWSELHPSMTEVARACGVSKNTVSLALRGSPRVAEATRHKVQATAAAMGYQLNPTVAQLMTELRKGRSPGFQAVLAIINAHETRDAFTKHSTIPVYVRGCRKRAAQLGYQLDEFWLHEPKVPVARWISIFKARNIRGIVIVGLMHGNRLPARLAPLWDEFPALVTGVRTREPALSFACSDHHTLALVAFEKAIALGYRRPALVLDGVIDQLTEGRLSAGFLIAQSHLLPPDQRTQPFYDVAAARTDANLFRSWFEANQPDLIFTLYHEVGRWVRNLGLRVPDDIGLIQYEWRPPHAEWAGMDQRNDLVGEAAVDMLISMIHHNERAVPEHPRATLIGSQWVDGSTVMPRSSA